ncbi:hypothetical protein [Acidithiobacillus sp. AMEEHan]|uniref:hypothetical protein n=1 Tax=Acidithiobacillus sp. AMEEHan TaxID=2994951 RepID=UPI0027E474AE|nr:hypothetical protein [Acidithiobacillus sp. AMEEHan]
MKQKLAVAAAVGLAVCSFSAIAFASGAESSIVAANNEVGIAAVGTLMNYQENLPSPSDTESGWMPGFEFKYSLMGNYFSSLPSNIYFAVNYQFNSGGIHYDGANLATHKPVQTTDDATTNRVLARIGKGFTIARSVMLTPYIAGGYQDWNRHLSAIETEDYSSGLVGAGALFQYAATSDLVLSANLEGLAMVGAGMTPHLAGLPDLGSASFKTSGQEKIGVDADYKISGPWHIYGGLSFTHFNYTGGELKYGFFEPSSQTNLFSMDAGIGYQF